ncbi:hypothetical protein SPHV1_200033 [Novosphingobium sp. KN65.2]|nr:hypothetical protein SPHV1_200033 [Novosphingobium sp. KN65.2]
MYRPRRRSRPEASGGLVDRVGGGFEILADTANRVAGRCAKDDSASQKGKYELPDHFCFLLNGHAFRSSGTR